MKRISIVVDNYKVDKFKGALTKAGFESVHVSDMEIQAVGSIDAAQ